MADESEEKKDKVFTGDAKGHFEAGSHHPASLTETPKPEETSKEERVFGLKLDSASLVLVALLVLSVASLGYQVLPLLASSQSAGFLLLPASGDSGVSSSNGIDMGVITEKVVPKEGYTTNAVWGDLVKKMIDSGALDVDKFEKAMSRYGQSFTEEQRELFTADYSNQKIKINAENGVFLNQLLWTVGKHNDNPLLHESTLAQYFKDYDIGMGRAGYGDTKLLELTPEQQEVVEYVAKNAYRPCCGNPTAEPDCSHGFSALALIEIMASQGFSKEEIFDAFVSFNSFWFPSNYIQNAVYFKVVEDKEWEEVDRELIASADYSSLMGKRVVQQKLQELGV